MKIETKPTGEVIIGEKPTKEKLIEMLEDQIIQLNDELDAKNLQNVGLADRLEYLQTELEKKANSKDINVENFKKEIKKPLPFWKRAVFDTFREGSFAISGVLVASGSWDFILEFLNSGDFSFNGLYKLLLSILMALAGYLQAIAKAERKQAEKVKNIYN
jgi:hypothetical protein